MQRDISGISHLKTLQFRPLARADWKIGLKVLSQLS
jgi:hypothetical protein